MPPAGVRHAFEDRWPSVLQAKLGGSARVIAEGLNGRTTAFDDHLAGADRNGARILPTLLTSHAPLDLVIVMLGANDMKPFISGYAIGAKRGHGTDRRTSSAASDWPLADAGSADSASFRRRRCRESGKCRFPAAMFDEGGLLNRGNSRGHYAELAAAPGAASSTPALWPRPRRSTASTSMRRTRVRSEPG